MMKLRKSRTIPVAIGPGALLLVSGCKHKSDTVSHNLSQDADSYKVFRQIVVYNASRTPTSG